MELKVLNDAFSVCKVRDFSQADLEDPFCFLGKTDEERSLVCRTERVPENVTEREDGWRAFRIQGVLDFSLIGVLAKISALLAEQNIGIFVVSTYNTDYVFTKKEAFPRALSVLEEAGYCVNGEEERGETGKTEPWWKLLQPLRIPPGWQTLWNKLEAAEPETLDPEDRAWLFTYVQDMVYMVKESKEQKLALDLGWYPDGDPQGAYRLEAILNDDWNDPLLSFTTRSTRAVAETLEYWLFTYFRCGQVHEKDFRKRHPNKR